SLSHPRVPPVTGTQDTRDVAWSPDSRLVATAHCDGKLRLWDVRTRKQTVAPVSTASRGELWRVCFSGDGSKVVTCSGDGADRGRDARTGRKLPAEFRHADYQGFWTMAVSRQGRHVATGGHDATIRVWSAADPGKAPLVLKADSLIGTLAFTPDEQLLL